jgi:hypothetical protein
MCLDIDPDSVIHKQLCLKSTSTCYENRDGVQSKLLYSEILPSHNLTVLPSFHISLGAPHNADLVNNTLWGDHCFSPNLEAIIGNIVLADICISEKNNKKAAWIPLNPDIIDKVLPNHIDTSDFEYWLCRKDSKYTEQNPVKIMHISLANLTGKPRDSIARPEDCIIDTITS